MAEAKNEDARFITCSICALIFDEQRLIPKFLSCGHTLCLNCLDKILCSSKACPECRAVLVGASKDYVTNFIVLRENNKQTVFLERSSLIDKRFGELMTNIIDTTNENVAEINAAMEKLRVESDEKALQEATDCLLKHEAKTELVISTGYWKVKERSALLLKDFGSNEEYYFAIFDRVSNKELMFAVHPVNDKMMYGEITIDHDMLLFHTLCLEKIPPSASYVWVAVLADFH